MSKFPLKIIFLVLLFLLGFQVVRAVPVSFFKKLDFSRLAGFETKPAAVGYNLALADLGGDGVKEIVLSALFGQAPEVFVYRADGSLVNKFLAYGEDFLGGVSVAAGDFNGDKKDEIVTGAGETGGPHVRVFGVDGRPMVNDGFFAFDKDNYRAGISVGAADVDGNKVDEILVASGFGEKPMIKIFYSSGELIKEFKIDDWGGLSGVRLERIDLGADGKEEILVSASYGGKPYVAIYRANGSLVNKFLVYPDNFLGGVSAAGFDFDDKKGQEIFVMAGTTGGPHLKIFDSYGHLLKEGFLGATDQTNGFNLKIGEINKDGQAELVTVAQNSITGQKNSGRYVDVDVSDQALTWYDSGYQIAGYKTSTGKPSTPTRLGNFKVLSKYEMAYGGGDGQTWGMPKFIGFYRSGSMENGIHALPYIDGVKEGARSLGRAVSHGCVRLADLAAAKLFGWIKVGDGVIVHQ